MNIRIECNVTIDIHFSGGVNAAPGEVISVPAESGIVPVVARRRDAGEERPSEAVVEVGDDELPPTLREGRFPRTLRGLGFGKEGFDGR